MTPLLARHPLVTIVIAQLFGTSLGFSLNGLVAAARAGVGAYRDAWRADPHGQDLTPSPFARYTWRPFRIPINVFAPSRRGASLL